MNTPRFCRRIVFSLGLIALPILAVRAVTFSSNTLISFDNTNYDGAGVVVTNCTVTIDGDHSFASVAIQNGGVLTHSADPHGYLAVESAIANESYVLTGTNAVVLTHSNVVSGTVLVTDTSGLVTYTNDVDYLLTSPAGAPGAVAIQRSDTSAIPDGGTVLLSYLVSNTVPTGLNLEVSGDFSIDSGGAIDADARGYGGGLGPGDGYSSAGNAPDGSGAGHGGYGGMSSSNAVGGNAYDFAFQPTDKGSGGGAGLGGAGGSGGGAIRVNVEGNLQIDGMIFANGQDAANSRSGGGAGGSIWLSAQTVSGSGWIWADGGAGEPIHGGGGGGGMIALYASTNHFTGSLSAQGGGGFVVGGAGTVYTQGGSPLVGLMVLDNAGRSGTNTPLAVTNAADVVVRGGASASVSTPDMIGNLLVASNSWILAPPRPSTLTLTATADVTLERGGGIRVDGSGYSPGIGAGAGGSTNAVGSAGYVGSGGGYGGAGGAGGIGPKGGNSYGNVSQPSELGSGGGNGGGLLGSKPGGAGGGAILLTVGGSLCVDGSISANGDPSTVTHGGGGAGGSISITTGSLSGSGTISANGGAGLSLGGGGGGGRVAILCSTNAFLGSASAFGGGGASWGGAGTVLWIDAGATGNSPDRLVVDNHGQAGAPTTLGSYSRQGADLNVAGGASLVWPPSGLYNLGNLLITSNAWLYVTNPVFMQIFITNNATIQAGGGLIADGAGYTADAGGPGGGRRAYSPSTGGGGGGYGGMGANGAGASISGGAGGTAYGYLTTPADRGSGGGSSYLTTYGNGGAGGGSLFLTITRTLQLDGLISANGFAASGTNSGGGSGGTIRISTGSISGSGILSASGGDGVALGGGGAGGRISIIAGTNTFTGRMTAYGGGGYAWGGAGTIYLAYTGKPISGQVVIDNGGRSGTNATLGISQVGPIDLTLQSGGNLALRAPQTFGNLVISSNAWLYVSNPAPVTITVISNVTILKGGGISADAGGFGPGQGIGAGRIPVSSAGAGSGGGFGGYGAPTTVPGGNAYGLASVRQVTMGSGGGNAYSSQGGGGVGGGAVQMLVTGSLLLDGRISADGGNASVSQAGGGSGGSVLLILGGLSGAGVISADGGNSSLGGGGGGGRIGVYYQSNCFTGTITAQGGGGGGMRGGAGTVFIQPPPTAKYLGQLIADNGGFAGTNTLLLDSGTFSLAVQGGARFVSASPSATFSDLLIASNSWVIVTNSVPLLVYGDATIRVGGGITANGGGERPGTGAGAGNMSTPVKGGAGHGGLGGANATGGGRAYGSLVNPLEPGSGGGNGSGSSAAPYGGAGGGVVRMTVTGALNLDGRISADGDNGGQNSGGGSGGSVNLTVGTLSGSGLISAKGGAGDVVTGAGGGGGGRVAIQLATNLFAGNVSARGGAGGVAGGAGTIYWKPIDAAMGQVIVDNGGQMGTNTPVDNVGVFDLTVSGGAVAFPSTSYLILSNLMVSSGGVMTSGSGESNLQLSVLSNMVVAAGSGVVVDGLGFGQAAGPGAGQSANGYGAGAGYGGHGGESPTAPGGVSYGSATQPADPGSGGGFGAGPVYGGGSQGGGAMRLDVGGNLTVDGWLSANGTEGLQDNSGGGSGGSIWVNARTLFGSGFIMADGGNGEFLSGGGGSGGRVAIYHLRNNYHTNTFTGLISAYGGAGYWWGDDGSVFLATSGAGPQVIGQTPVGAVTYSVDAVAVTFNTAIDPYSVSVSSVSVTTPGGELSPGVLACSLLNPYTLQVGFPSQSEVGPYTLTVGPQIEDLYGQPMTQAYTGSFAIVLPTVSGLITDTNGLPVAGVTLQPDAGLTPTTTDSSGHYALGFAPGSSFTVTPVFTNGVFLPGSRSYTNLTSTVTNEDYLLVGSIAPLLQGQPQDGHLLLSWQGLVGVTYQIYYSTNLPDWMPYSDPFAGSNTLVEIPLPINSDEKEFFRVQAHN